MARESRAATMPARRTGETTRALWLAWLASVLVLAACGNQEIDRLTATSTPAPGKDVVGLFAVDDQIVDVGTGRRVASLRHEVAAPLQGSPVVISPEGERVLYSVFDAAGATEGAEPGGVLGRPAIRVASLDGSSDELVESGAVSPAWGAGDRIAYVRGVDPVVRQGRPFTGWVVVRDGLKGAPVAWTSEPGPFDILGWAGATLIVSRLTDDGFSADIYAMEGPGQERLLAGGEGVMAIGPGGREVLLARGATLRILRLTDGSSRPVDLDLSGFGGGAVDGFQSGPSWVGARLVAAASVGGSPALIVVDMAALRVVGLVRLNPARYPSLHDPYFLPGGALAAWAPDGVISLRPGQPPPRQPYVLLRCALGGNKCREDPLPAGQVVARVRTISRMLGIDVREAAA